MILLHGEQLIKSRQRLAGLIDQARADNHQITRLTSKHLTPADLEQALGSSSLFTQPETIIIEELHSLPRSKRKTALIELVGAASSRANKTNIDSPKLILWEKRQLTPTMLKVFSQASIETFKASKLVFRFLEQLRGDRKGSSELLQQLRQALDQDGEMFIFTMLARQIRMLIQVKDGGRPAGPPFVIQKLSSQARTFSLPKLLQLHGQLTKIDYEMKRSKSLLSVGQRLDLILLNM